MTLTLPAGPLDVLSDTLTSKGLPETPHIVVLVTETEGPFKAELSLCTPPLSERVRRFLPSGSREHRIHARCLRTRGDCKITVPPARRRALALGEQVLAEVTHPSAPKPFQGLVQIMHGRTPTNTELFDAICIKA